MEARSAIARRRLEKAEQDKSAQFYPTSPWITEALLAREKLPGPVWEPACGEGTMARVLESHGYVVAGTDLNDYGYGEPRLDFTLAYTVPSVDGVVCRTIMTNPPFGIATLFVRHALALPGIEAVAMLVKLSFLAGLERRRTIYKEHPPHRAWVFSARPAFMMGTTNTKGISGVFEYCWLVWRRGPGEPWPAQETRLGWIDARARDAL
jgi:hypothetical protein